MNYTNNEIPESLLAEIRPQWERILDHYLTRAKNKGHICPHCQNGNGKSGTGIIEKDGTNYIKCFKCGMVGTIFSWVMYIENCNFRESVAHCADILGIPFGEEEIKRHRRLPQPPPPPKEKAVEEEIDLTPIFEEAHKHINETDYPQKRGLTEKTIEHYNLGYIPEWKHPKIIAREKNEPNFHIPSTPRVITPTSKVSYMARLAMIETPAGMEGYTKLKINCSDDPHFFNIQALENEIAFLVEGEWDAMSFYEADAECIALGSIVMVKAFVKTVIESQKLPKILIIAPDNDPKPETKKLVTEKVEYIKTELSKIGIYVHIANIAGDFKDVNNRLVADRDDFIAAVQQAKADAIASKEEEVTKQINDSPLINNCAFVKSVITKKSMPDDKIVKAAFTLIWHCHWEPEAIIKKLLRDWLGDKYTEEKVKEYIDYCKEKANDAPKSITCSFVRNELGFTKCPVKDEVCNEIESPTAWADLSKCGVIPLALAMGI